MQMKKVLLGALCIATIWCAPLAHADSVGDQVYMEGIHDNADSRLHTDSQWSFEPELPLSPMSQQNAVQKAQDYLDYTAFSRQGLIKQLEYDNFSPEDATFAVDSITVDWNKQAAKKAKDYLDYTAFSHGGLIKQLEYDGFTPAQAEYGVAAAGL
jgi:hypothetical protein